MFDGRDGLVVLAGDFNATPEQKPIGALKAKWSEAINKEPTYPANNPRRKIDYIFYRSAKTVQVRETRVINAPMTSDHLPLLSVLEW